LKMLSAVVCVLLVAAASGRDLRLDDQWTSFKSLYAKQYSLGEDVHRRSVWEDNLQIIQQHNLKADRGEHTFWLGENEYADLHITEFVAMMNGYQLNASKVPDFFVPENKADDDTVDWRTKGYVTPVKNQERCGSCWAFSSTGSLEGQHFKKAGSLVSLSEQNLVDCSKKEGNKGCQGGLMEKAFAYIKINNGIDTETSYPYKGKNGMCEFKAADVGATDTGSKDIERSEDALKTAVSQIGPISVAMDASHSSFQLYKRGVYSEPRCSSKKLDHGVLAVGYGSEGEKDFWIVKNSWGATWGMEGYFELARNKNNMCGIATAACYPLV